MSEITIHTILKQAAVELLMCWLMCWRAPCGGAYHFRLDGREFCQLAFELADVDDVRESLSFFNRGVD